MARGGEEAPWGWRKIRNPKSEIRNSKGVLSQ
jgi:hypothetical protein